MRGSTDCSTSRPERLAGDGSEAFQVRLERWNVAFVAVDEAHCISQWGHEFRPEYRQLGRVKSALPATAWHAFTATATERVRDDICVAAGAARPRCGWSDRSIVPISRIAWCRALG